MGYVVGMNAPHITMPAKLLRSGKEAIRHALYSFGLRNEPEHLRPDSRRDRFARIYQDGVWQLGNDGTPLSGNGSSLEAAAHVAAALPMALSHFRAKTLLDIGCGDMTWMRNVPIEGYIGIDVVPSLIEANRKAFPDRDFRCLDAVTDALPRTDAALCREVLFHLSFADAKALLGNIRKAGILWLFATTDTSTLFNSDIATGDFRPVNFRKAPFRFPKPATWFRDDAVAPGRRIAVWPMRALPL